MQSERLTAQAYQQISDDWQINSKLCSACGECTSRCHLLADNKMNIGKLSAAGLDLLSTLVNPCYDANDNSYPTADNAVLNYITNDGFYNNLVRSCSLCSACTTFCPSKVKVLPVMKSWRRLLASSNVIPVRDFRMLMIDQTWHLYSVFRKVYGIEYPEILDLQTAEPGQADLLFFPGCVLYSYLPELVRLICDWFTKQDISFAMTDFCCGSPLNSTGQIERADAYKARLKALVEQAGIKRVVTVCAGCTDELNGLFDEKVEVCTLPRILLENDVVFTPAAAPGNPVYTLFDSCNDRSCLHGQAIRQLMRDFPINELQHHGQDTLCCGAGGIVATYDPTLCHQRIDRVLDECTAAAAGTVVLSCPYCAYSFADALNRNTQAGKNLELEHRHYLELMFDTTIDWQTLLERIAALVSSTDPWVIEQLFGEE